MSVNPLKPLSFRNRTKYFIPDKDKTKVIVASPDSYSFKCTKQDGYEARLYWQFEYCKSVNGQTFYYTLTYNDAHIPQYFGLNCFDYEDLRYLLTGGFRKMLLRKYGTIFKYFIGAELGDGKGKRGMANNPHYHVLFFLEPDPDCKFPYLKISSEDFRHLVKMYWQGFDENDTGYQDYRTALFGIAKEGDNVGLVTDMRACCYCAKYVCKDLTLKQHEDKVERSLRLKFKRQLIDNYELYEGFYRGFIYDRYNTPLNSDKTRFALSDVQLSEMLVPNFSVQMETKDGDTFHSSELLIPYVKEIIKVHSLWHYFADYRRSVIDDLVRFGLNEYRNRYCNKCRISQGVGDYALKELRTMNNPLVKVPDKEDGFKYRPLSMYYYRKLFTQVVRPIVFGKAVGEKPSALSPIRILNKEGIEYKKRKLLSSIDKVSDAARNNLSLIIDDDVLFDKMRASDVNIDVNFTYSQFVQCYNSVCDGRFGKANGVSSDGKEGSDVFTAYAVYKLVYEGRYFKEPSDNDFGESGFPDIRVFDDYERFLVPSFYSVSRSDIALEAFLDDGCKGYLPYSQHPYFLRYIGIFRVFDLCADYFFIQKDRRLQKEADERKKVKRFHDSRRLNEFYSHFK